MTLPPLDALDSGRTGSPSGLESSTETVEQPVQGSRKRTAIVLSLLLALVLVVGSVTVWKFFVSTRVSTAASKHYEKARPIIPANTWSTGPKSTWSIPAENALHDFPIWIDESFLVVANYTESGDRKSIVGYDISKGEPRKIWDSKLDEPAISTIKYVWGRMGKNLYFKDRALNLETGKISKNYQSGRRWKKSTRIALFTNKAFIRCSKPNGRDNCTAWDTSGKKLWQKTLPGYVSNLNPLFFNDRIFVPMQNGEKITILDVLSGELHSLNTNSGNSAADVESTQVRLLPATDGWVSIPYEKSGANYHIWSPTGEDRGIVTPTPQRDIASGQAKEFLLPVLPEGKSLSTQQYKLFFEGDDGFVDLVLKFDISLNTLKINDVQIKNTFSLYLDPEKFTKNHYFWLRPVLSSNRETLFLTTVETKGSIPVVAAVNLKENTFFSYLKNAKVELVSPNRMIIVNATEKRISVVSS